jgi:hypothetical protein
MSRGRFGSRTNELKPKHGVASTSFKLHHSPDNLTLAALRA